jgi:hypothetical protein
MTTLCDMITSFKSSAVRANTRCTVLIIHDGGLLTRVCNMIEPVPRCLKRSDRADIAESICWRVQCGPPAPALTAPNCSRCWVEINSIAVLFFVRRTSAAQTSAAAMTSAKAAGVRALPKTKKPQKPKQTVGREAWNSLKTLSSCPLVGS